MDKEYRFCLRCNRKLKTTEARQIGYGPVCLKKVREQSSHKQLFPVKKYVD